MTRRKVIQIATAVVPWSETNDLAHITTVLCDDGTIWENSNGKPWYQIEPVPQPEPNQ